MDLQEAKRLKKKIGEKIRVIYYISDIHFNDEKIFDKCKRPFESIDEMADVITHN